MKFISRSLGLLVTAYSISALGAPLPASPSAAQQQLARSYMAAVRAGNRAQLAALLHPKVAACQNASNREYFDYVSSQSMRDVPRGKYTVTLTAIPPGGAPAILPATMFKYPIQPQFELQIDGDRTAPESASVIRTIAPQDGRWYIVYPCPNAAGIKYFHENIARGRRQRQQAQALASQVKEPLLAQLKSLLRQGRKIDAIHKYKAATGVDLTTAVQVVDVLDSERH